MKEWILVLHQKEEAALGQVRCIPGLKAARNDEQIWLRGWFDEQPLPLAVKQLPVKHTYQLDEQGQLFPQKGLTPVRVLPQLAWQSLREFVSLELPTAALPAQPPEPLVMSLVPSKVARVGTALLTSLSQWISYVETAPLVRLERWQYAVSEKMQVLVIGPPLPPLPGQEYWQCGPMLLPCGFDFEYPFLSNEIHQRLNPNKDGIILWSKQGNWQYIRQQDIVPVSRSGVRQLTLLERP